MPPLQPQSPMATTSFGSGVVSAPQRRFHVARYRPGHEQEVGVPRARDEADAQALEVVVRAVAGVDLELAAVARAGVDMADGERAPEVPEQRLLQPLLELAKRRLGLRRGLGDDPGLRDLPEDLVHR